MAAAHLFYEGRVQGVGFRYTVKSIARGFEVTGWIRNLADGRVEMEASSENAKELEEFLEAIRDSALKSHIKREDRGRPEQPTPLAGFIIAADG